MTFVVNLDNDGVLCRGRMTRGRGRALDEQVGDVEVEGGETAYVVACLLAVYPHVAVVVDSTEVEQGTVVAHGHCLETGLEPYRAFVEEETIVLCVPVAGNLHGGRLVEVVFYQVLGTLGFRIEEESPTVRVHAIVVVAFFLHVNNVVPRTIERHALVG